MNTFFISPPSDLETAELLPGNWRIAALSSLRGEELGKLLDGDQATDWLEAASASGQAEVQIRLGRMLLAGEEMTENKRAAFACFLCAANQGDAEAENLLGRCYENGWGVAVDRQQARACFRRAAEAGDYRGAFNHATYIAADGCLAGALHWYECALANAPGPAREYMQMALSRHPCCAVRTLATDHQ